MAPTYSVALIQLHPEPLQPKKNFDKAANFIASAAQRGAHLAVLPEYHLTNWEPDHPDFIGSCASWETYLRLYQDLARKHKICIVPGTILETIKDENTEEDQLCNIAYFIDDKGKILGRYQKKNLWHPERPHLTSSTTDHHTTIQTPLGPIGLLICWDLAFPEAFRELIATGAKIIIIPTFWTHTDCSAYGLSKNPMAEKLFLESTLTTRAFENTCAAVFVNAGAASGADNEKGYAGLSRVTLPFVGAMGDETKDTYEEGMSVVHVDMELVAEAEKHYKVREDIGGDEWHYTYRHQGGES